MKLILLAILLLNIAAMAIITHYNINKDYTNVSFKNVDFETIAEVR